MLFPFRERVVVFWRPGGGGESQVWALVAADKGVAPVRIEGDIEIVISCGHVTR